jgi:hypothetical protein
MTGLTKDFVLYYSIGEELEGKMIRKGYGASKIKNTVDCVVY